MVYVYLVLRVLEIQFTRRSWNWVSIFKFHCGLQHSTNNEYQDCSLGSIVVYVFGWTSGWSWRFKHQRTFPHMASDGSRCEIFQCAWMITVSNVDYADSATTLCWYFMFDLWTVLARLMLQLLPSQLHQNHLSQQQRPLALLLSPPVLHYQMIQLVESHLSTRSNGNSTWSNESSIRSNENSTRSDKKCQRTLAKFPGWFKQFSTSWAVDMIMFMLQNGILSILSDVAMPRTSCYLGLHCM